MVSKARIASLFARKRYWYHVSTTLRKRTTTLTPWDGVKAVNRDPTEPAGKRICVAPTVEQCIVAIPYHLGATVSIYRTKDKVMAEKPKDVFDANVTGEGWITVPTTFVKIGRLNFEDIEQGLGVEHVIEEVASNGEVPESRNSLRWWKKARIKRFVKQV